MIGTYLVDSVTLRMHKGADKHQEPFATEDTTVKVFVESGEWQIKTATGNMLVSRTRVLMKPRTIIYTGFATRATNTISHQDKILIDGYAHAISHISTMRDFTVRAFGVYLD